MPGAVRTIPADAKHTKYELLNPRGRPVAESGQVRDHAQVPEDQRDRKVGADRNHVPYQWRTEVDPQRTTLVGKVREDEISQPRAPHVNRRKQSGAHHGKDSHGFGGTVDRSPPLLAKQKKNGGYE